MAVKGRTQTGASAKGSHLQGIQEMLRRKARDIVVAKDRSVEVGPDTGFADHIAELELRSFDDLRTLHLIAPALDENRTRQAIAADDARVFELAHEQVRDGAAECDCHGAVRQKSSVAPFHERLRSTYGVLRKHHHVELARVISDNLRRQIEWDSLEVQLTWSWIHKLTAMPVIKLRGIFAKDIIVGSNATMTLAATTKYLHANDIKIHVGGKIVVKGSYMKVQCKSAHGNLP